MHQLQLKCRFITDLRLTHCALGDYSIKEISKINLMFLVTLDLTHNNITAEGVHTLVKDPGCAYKYLQVLYLGYNRIKNKGLKYVSQAHWLKLHTLNLCSISPTNDGLKYLQNLPFPLLRELIFYNNHIQLDSLSLLLKARSKTILLSCVSLRGKGKLECICCSENLVFKNYVVKLKGTVIQDGVSALLKTFRSRLTY
jgi:Ran GTPase-activating protein (RanGAP) involved in mRNA processing and transport